MKGLIRASLGNPHAVVVMSLSVVILGLLALTRIPVDILPVSPSKAVQVLTFYGGMAPEDIEKDITNRMERWVGQANGIKRQESRSILGASIVWNYFYDDQDLAAALSLSNSLALGVVPNLPPGTLPPVVLPFDPTSTTPVALVALDSKKQSEAILYDIARYQVRNYIMQNRGATAPVVIGGTIRAVILYLNESQMQSLKLSAADVMRAVARYNLFFASGDVKIGDKDFALASNSMYEKVGDMKGIPISQKPGEFTNLEQVATPKDASLIQTSIVRVGGPEGPSRKQVYIPVYRQTGASTLAVVDTLRERREEMLGKINPPGYDPKAPEVDLKVIMDQSIYVRASIHALLIEGLIGAMLCSTVILLFLGQWRMTIIAIATLPLAALVSVICLSMTGQTINVMTLAGLTLAIGPMIDSAIICLENTHRHLTMGASPKQAALDGASEVAMPELVSTLCTFLVLSPLALMPGMGKFLFLPMTLAVMFAMTAAYILSRTLVPCASAFLLSGHGNGHAEDPAHGTGLFAGLQRFIDRSIGVYVRMLDFVLRHRVATVVVAFTLLAVVLVAFIPILRRDFFPESDSGAFEIAARAPSGTRIEVTEKLIEKVENSLRKNILKEDLELIVSEIGLTADWSAAYTPNAGPMDTIVKVQLTPERRHTSQEYIRQLRKVFAADADLVSLEFSFDAGGLVRGALNEGKSSPINIQLTGKNQAVLFVLADRIKSAVRGINGIVDPRVIQRPDAPQLIIEVDRTKAQNAGLTQDDVMKNIIAATNSSITYNKRNFWIDPVSGNQYYVGVQYPPQNFQSIEDVENITITSPKGGQLIYLKNIAKIRHAKIPTELHHVNLQPAIDLTMNVEGRDLGHVSDDVARILDRFGTRGPGGKWAPYDPQFSLDGNGFKIVDRGGKKVAQWQGARGEPREAPVITEKDGKRVVRWTNEEGRTQQIEIVTDRKGRDRVLLPAARIVLAGEYTRMQNTFRNLGFGLILASLLIYFLMVALDRSFVVPLAVMTIVPLCLIGILPMLFITGSAVNVQSLLGFIFIVGIKVANTVLMTDYAQELRRHERLSPIAAIRKAAALRVRPVTMTALAAFFAMIPTALALEHGSEANAPLARAILGGLLAGEPATLFVLPALYSLLVRDKNHALPAETAAHAEYEGTHPPDLTDNAPHGEPEP